jgi:glycosyltransferase involved in cell wall biosynthesis
MELKHKSTLKEKIRTSYFNLINLANKFVSDGQTAITERCAQLIGIPKERLWGTWPSGVNLTRFSTQIHNRKWPLEGETIHLMYVGVLHYERNLMPLAQAVLRANKEDMNISLTLIGMGTERWALEELADQNRLHFSVLPPIPHTEIPAQLVEAHIGVLPFPDLPQFGASSPIKLFEYMASGLPILATRIDCHTDVIGDGKYVFWAEDGSEDALLSAIRKIWEHQSSLQQMSLESSKAAESWTWEKSAQRLMHALEYGQLIKNVAPKKSKRTRVVATEGILEKKLREET